MRTWMVAAGVVALTVAGCSSGEQVEQPEQTTGAAQPGSDLAAEAGSTEVQGAQPRLVISDADSGRIDVLDLATEEQVHSFDVENPATLTTINGRYVVATDDERASLLDPGSWTIEHGDHSHSYIKDPVTIGTLDGDKPAHVIAGDRKVAVFFDGTGSADVVDFDSLSKVDATVDTTIESEPQHGIAVPLSDHFVVSTGGSEEDLPNGLELRDGSGEFVRALDGTCPEMHGEAVFSNYFVVACADGVLKVDSTGGDFTTTAYPYPPNVERAWSLTSGTRGSLVTAPTQNGVLVLDSRSGQFVEARTADEAVASGISGDGKTVMSLQQDGTFRTFDATTGVEVSSTPVLAGPVGEGDSPMLEIAGTRAYVSDPAGNTVVEIDYRDGGRLARTFDLDYSPSSIGVVGA